MDLTQFTASQDIDLTMRQLNHYVTPPHFALDDVTRFDYAATAEIAEGPLAQAALIDAAIAIQRGDIGLAEVHMAAARLLAGIQRTY